jgi:mitogen-activated protein kinase kinase kinase 4
MIIYIVIFSCNPGYAPDIDDPEETEDSLCNSIGLEQENSDPYHYGITPPTNTRAMKRAKEKARSHKFSSKTEMREIMHQIKREASPRGAVQTTPARPDAVYLSNHGNADPDSDDGKQNSSTRKRRPSGNKHYKVSRRQDRDYKHQSGSANVSTSIPKYTVLQVDSPNHFKSLDTKIQVGSSVLIPSLGDVIPGCALSSNSTSCSKDRLMFIRTFNMLIRMGNKATKDRESRAAQLDRQLSTELQAKYSDIIWLELRAYLNKRKAEEQDDLQYRLQLQVPRVLREIMNFKVNLQKQPPLQRPIGSSDAKSPVIAEVEEDQHASGEIFSLDMDSVEKLSHDKKTCRLRNSSVLSFSQGISDTGNEQEVALLQVASLLDKLERVETLYPTYKAFGMAHSLYNDPVFVHKLRTLYLWINITIEMGNKLHHISKMLHIDSMGVEWPWLHYNPKQFLEVQGRTDVIHPYVTQPSDDTDSEDSDDDYDSDDYETEESEEEVDGEQSPNKLKLPHLKNVRFEISDSNSSAPQSPECDQSASVDRNIFLSPTDSSTPCKPGTPSRNSSVLSVSRSSSNLSFEDSTRTTIYRNYADRMLKRTGVTKLKTRLKDLLEGTLQRAKGALEKPRSPPSYASVTSLEVCAFLSTVSKL